MNQSANPPPLKVAIFYDWLNQWGGAERLLLDILSVFPKVDLFSLIHSPKHTKWLPKDIKITTSFIQKLPLGTQNYPCYTPLYPLAAEQLKLNHYQLIISLTSSIGHCLLTPASTPYICYYLNPNRHLYQPNRGVLNSIINLYKPLDQIMAKRPDFNLAISKTVQKRLLSVYGINSNLVYPGIDTDYFTPTEKPKNNYLLAVSRLVPHKNIEVAITACHLSKKPLLIIGTGRHYRQLSSLIKKLGAKNIRIRQKLSDSQIKYYYQNCTALICPQVEDFGLAALEAQSCGRPVIANKSGGFSETIVNNQTGLLVDCNSPATLAKALSSFTSTNFSSQDCRQQAFSFSKKRFMLNFKRQVDELYSIFRRLPNNQTFY